MVVPEMSGSERLKSFYVILSLRNHLPVAEAELGVKLNGDDYEGCDCALCLN